MPWSIAERNGEWCVVKKGETTPITCHATRAQAERHQAALYANEPAAQGAFSASAPCDCGGSCSECVERVMQAAGDASHLIEWYNAGADGAIDWGSHGDFEACVAIAEGHVDDPQAFCAARHMDATGEPAG